MKDILTYLTEAAGGGRAVEMRIKSKQDFLIQVSNASKLNSKFAQNIGSIAKYLNMNVVTFNVDNNCTVDNIVDNINNVAGEIKDNNGKCIVLLVVKTDDKHVMNALQPIFIAHDFQGKRFKDIIIGVAAPKNVADNFSEPVKTRLGSPIMM